jgi:EAL domain-containing protein (putative c-di-GMP-specific phosphodiesterase class I)
VFLLAGQPIHIGASVGITVFPDDSQDADAMLRDADMAMYRAKEAGRDRYQFYTAAMNEEVRRRSLLEQDLRAALEEGALEVHYQPIVDLTAGRMSGVEALVRWHHPERGPVSPEEFIPLAEETGLIEPLGRWVLTAACARVREWDAAGVPPLKVSVNISSRQGKLGFDRDRLKTLLREGGVSGERLSLEITEGILMDGTPEAAQWLAGFKSLGLGLALDDFGTGYSSLSYLKRFPVDTLKIDRAFVSDLPADPGDVSLVQAIVAMARGLGLDVVAEGVETHEQLQLLQGLGCRYVQGYLFSRAVPGGRIPHLARHLGIDDQGRVRRGDDLRLVSSKP